MSHSDAEDAPLDALLGAFTRRSVAFPSPTICDFRGYLRPVADFRVFSRMLVPLLRLLFVAFVFSWFKTPGLICRKKFSAGKKWQQNSAYGAVWLSDTIPSASRR